MNCKNFRRRTRTKNKKRTVYLYCTELRKEITFNDCKGCPYKEYKVCRNSSFEGNFGQKKDKNNKKCTKTSKNSAIQQKKSTKLSKNVQIKRKSSKLAKLERERQSLFTDDLDHCIICGKSPVNKHEIFGGRNRQNSMIYRLVIPLCTAEHHSQIECKGIHFDKNLRDEWHVKGQLKFEEVYSDLDFVKIFGINYK